MGDTKFSSCLAVVLKHEGGFVNHPKDPGGATNMGITKKTYEDWVGHEVTLQKMKELTVNDVTPIYRQKYWKVIKGDALTHGVDLQVFDFGVNAGPARSIKILQRVVEVPEDGIIGPATLKALEAKQNKADVIRQLGEERLKYYKSLSTFDTFGRGWTKRTEETTQKALEMLQ